MKQTRLHSLYRLTAFLLSIIFAFVYFSSLVAMHPDHGLGMTPTTGGCALALAEGVPCFMSINEHINSWHSTFLGIVAAGAALALIVIISAWLILPRPPFSDQNTQMRGSVREKIRYRRRNPLDQTYTYLRQIFAQGILQSRLYA
ncbi:MAG: hypothetical protein UY92_C0003G0039 [Candidatus Magasanikbacteria bacterium GW2011_GWA2_56_11]|uniref:Uncharacterized protein n=1 Tax=Candidatus Magasanikbacteria bacterium GW2011_GWA2_56_11 TaxID=1619044 RepID=A0A0G1YHB6_9BACT|nr:MAG: hypothetical protein UY92_C0003G0039 [Candidatus Magasanikbacteria bacterium GW2011_GWA2_56_11]